MAQNKLCSCYSSELITPARGLDDITHDLAKVARAVFISVQQL